MNSPIIPQFTNDTVSSYVIEYANTVESKFVFTESTERQRILKALGEFIKSATDELKEARKLNQETLKFLK
jgi:hypothetical protein